MINCNEKGLSGYKYCIFLYLFISKESLSSLIFYLEKKKKIKLFISEVVKQELLKNIKIKIEEKVDIFYNIIPRFTILVDVTFDKLYEYQSIKKLPENDRIILTTAIFHKMDYFITGNVKDFQELYNKQIMNTTILNQRDFINLFIK